ncbi:hemimethylated DNA binding protein [Thioalkalivibrio nitratireducens DSM 14787]|uniref:Heat shock protein HspQ n=1 Tax=Thioalkalivibrio nitratireducens (strain DSM 14787 / UNIQEM 213 / ALEN2) TaxID=1255043 RepID=L0DSL9_THIND|nr:heat shock protein HspQ [Thioalkalivibrio nitratireducens]AGA32003.1 hemimethylated DNA binding protein [Thioalkalivibrio nitratireducens DSM 14787]
MRHAAFAIGQIIHFRDGNARGVVVDVDESFRAPVELPEQVRAGLPSPEQPWYYVLVDGTDDRVYVAEESVQADLDRSPVEHPGIDQFFRRFGNGRYQPQYSLN